LADTFTQGQSRLLYQHFAHIQHDLFIRKLVDLVYEKMPASMVVMAIARTILQMIYHMINRGEPYREMGGDYFDQFDWARTARRLVKRLEAIGYLAQLGMSTEPSPGASGSGRSRYCFAIGDLRPSNIVTVQLAVSGAWSSRTARYGGYIALRSAPGNANSSRFSNGTARYSGYAFSLSTSGAKTD
jgi:hypothetical protein